MEARIIRVYILLVTVDEKASGHDPSALGKLPDTI